MKKLFLATALALGLFAISATPLAKSKVQCGVSNAQIIAYLQGAPHYHPYVCCVTEIPGTCNSKATIENCGTATVFVQDGIVVGHSDANGICSGSIDKPAQDGARADARGSKSESN